MAPKRSSGFRPFGARFRPEDFPKEVVWKSAGRGDGVETFFDLGKAVAFCQRAALEFSGDHDRRYEGKARALACEETQHGHVVDFCGNYWPDAVLFEEQVESDPNVTVEAWQHKGRLLEVVGKAEAGALSGGGSHQTDRLLVEKAAVPWCFGVASNGKVGEDNVKRVGSKLGEEIAEISGTQNKFNVRASEETFDEAELKVSRERGDGANSDDLLSPCGAVSEDIHHFFTGAENGFRVFEGDLSGLVQHETFAAPFEKELPETVFEAA